MKIDRSTLGYRPCVGIMVLSRDGLVWVGRRADMPGEPEGPGAWWQMPQGGIDANEDERTAALRELYEETGMRTVEIIGEMPGYQHYDLPQSLLGKAWGGKYRGQRQKWFAMRFNGSETEIDIGPRGGHKAEFEAWRWAHMNELMSLIVPFKRDVYTEVVKAFAPLARSA
jgi:putative (di)nucleoside polyphosphate hydrolase